MTAAQPVETPVYVGVDGCPGGWIAAVLEPAERTLTWVGFSRLTEILAAYPSAFIGIDIPLGLWDRGDRPCDKEARRLLGKPRSSSVFPPPVPSILDCADYSAANDASRLKIGKGISRQAFELFPKMREGNEVVTPGIQHRVFEVHPEVSFFGLAGEAMMFPKRTEPGFSERRDWLNSEMDLRKPILERQNLRGMVRRSGAQPDDVLDAAVAAWTAHRVAKGEEVRLRGEGLHRGANGLIMEIVY